MKEGVGVSLERRLDRIEHSLVSVKVLLFVILVLVVVGLYGPLKLREFVGGVVFWLGLLACFLYAVLLLLDALLSRKLGPEEDRERQLEAEVRGLQGNAGKKG